MKAFLYFSLAVCLGHQAHAQNEIDILRYSYFQPIQNARVDAMGGAFGALGGDYSAIGINPAAIGTFTSRDFSIQLFQTINSTSSKYFDNAFTDRDSKFNFGNLSYVYTQDFKKSSLKQFGFGIGYKKVHDFEEQYFFSGFNPNNSILDAYSESLNSSNSVVYPNDVLAEYPDLRGEAYDKYLLEFDSVSQQYYPIYSGNILQTLEQDQVGSISDFGISFGGNFEDKLYVGGEINIRNYSYTQVRYFSETDTKNRVDGFNFFNQFESLNLSGSGVQAKFGVIYRATPFLRLGFAAHSRMANRMVENYEVRMDSDFDSFSITGNTTVFEPFVYNMRTPGRIHVSAALVQKIGSLSFDYDYILNNGAFISFVDDGFKLEEREKNQAIGNALQNSHNIRVGGELRFQNARLRAGYAYMNNPLKQLENTENAWNIQTLSVGGGMKFNQFYMDLAYRYGIRNFNDIPYRVSESLGESRGASLQSIQQNVLFTIGWRM